MFYLYILFSQTAKRHYIGHSENPFERLNQHNTNSIEKYTGKYTDWEIVALFETGQTRAEAMAIEKFIKKQKSKKLLLKLIESDFVPLDKLTQLVRVAHVRD
ncbi:MAG: GIY-YIG nuclease family protein [Bacteroidia bacterium]|nr:GIY-YIG nuclease family protein [Bacteroidia bacterium]